MNENKQSENYEIVDDIPSNQQQPNSEIEDNFKAVPNPKTPNWLDATLVFRGYLGLMLVPVLYQTILNSIYQSQGLSAVEIEQLLTSVAHLSMTNFIRYTVIFLLMVLVLFLARVLLPILNQFKKFRTYLYGIGFGFIAIFLSVSYNLFLSLVLEDFGSNENQNLVEQVIRLNPLLSLLWIPFLGPIVEELTYRLGIFNGLKKYNRTLAYVVTGLFFGLIHFNAPNIADENFTKLLVIEIANLPNYILSGLLFNYVYDKENLGTSIVAHVTNNFVSYIATIISMNS